MAGNIKGELILVGGGSCSGKTTLAAGLAESLRAFGTTVLFSMDNYYYDLSSLASEAADRRNFDCPEALDFGLLYRDLQDLHSGRPVCARSYDFKSHCASTSGDFIEAADFILLEGIFALYFGKLRELAAVSIFVHADADIRLARRLERDTAERRLPLKMVVRQYLQDVRPMHAKFVEPYGACADLLLDSNDCTPVENRRRAMEFLKNTLLLPVK
ncbi:MAG: uridine-cytidine kinase [Victivallales bacterium]|nr:uridine-cytidine kinase [Victivallales bacterium]